jgi:formylglycine-generating enzyme required for sulfatase activity
MAAALEAFPITSPVTRRQFAAFVKAENYLAEAEANRKVGVGFSLSGDSMASDPRNTWSHPAFEQADDHPVVHVSWNDAVKFCAWLSKKEDKTYELPKEAEWAYACRTGTATRFWWGDQPEDAKGKENIADASLRKKLPNASWSTDWDDGYPFTSPVGAFAPNPCGLYDINGNVKQWCVDRLDNYPGVFDKDSKEAGHGDWRVARGCSWDIVPKWCGSATRWFSVPDMAIISIGFRVVLRVPAGTP